MHMNDEEFHVAKVLVCFDLQVNSLHWVCLSKLPKIYGTNLWSCMIKTLDCIAEGVKVSLHH